MISVSKTSLSEESSFWLPPSFIKEQILAIARNHSFELKDDFSTINALV